MEQNKAKTEIKDNKMREILIDKVTVNIGVGSPGEALDSAQELLERITKKKAVKTTAKKRNPTWGLRKGLPIGVKVTLRGKDAHEFLAKAFKAKREGIKKSSFDNTGNLAFGIKSYIDLPDAKYDPNIGMYGMDVTVTLKRRGYRVKNRKIMPRKLGKNHVIKKEEAIEFIKNNFNVELV